MPTYKIEFEKAALKFLEKQDKTQRLRLYKAIYKLPFGTDIKKLKGTDMFRLRVGDYRILYTVESDRYVVLVIDIGNRGQIYNQY